MHVRLLWYMHFCVCIEVCSCTGNIWFFFFCPVYRGFLYRSVHYELFEGPFYPHFHSAREALHDLHTLLFSCWALVHTCNLFTVWSKLLLLASFPLSQLCADWLPLKNRWFKYHVGGVSMLTVRAVCLRFGSFGSVWSLNLRLRGITSI